MDATNRQRTASQFMRTNKEPIGLTKVQVRLGFNNLDDWFEANWASALASLPPAWSTGTTLAQKERAILMTLRRRLGDLRAEED